MKVWRLTIHAEEPFVYDFGRHYDGAPRKHKIIVLLENLYARGSMKIVRYNKFLVEVLRKNNYSFERVVSHESDPKPRGYFDPKADQVDPNSSSTRTEGV